MPEAENGPRGRSSPAVRALALAWCLVAAPPALAAAERSGAPPFVAARLDGQGRLVADARDAETYILQALDQGAWYRRLLRMPGPRSVAISTRTMRIGGAWGARGSAAEAVRACGGEATGCRVYLDADQVVWVPEATDPVPYASVPPPSARSDTATLEGALTGGPASRVACDREPDAVWVDAGGRPACIRYRHGGLSAASATVLLILDGDEVFALFGRGRSTISGVGAIAALAAKRNALLDRRVRAIAGDAGLPFIVLSRPGTGGSSGNQWRDGKTVWETEVLDGALDTLASRHGVTRWAIAGQSGGAAAAANLLARRRDIACAVLASGPLALRAQLALQGARGEALLAGLDDPIEHVPAMEPDPARRVFVLSDALDSLVPLAVQRAWAAAAAGYGHAVEHVVREGWGAGPHHHDLTWEAARVASLCGSGTSGEATLAAAHDDGRVGEAKLLLSVGADPR